MRIIQSLEQVSLTDNLEVLTNFFSFQYDAVDQLVIDYISQHLSPGNTVIVHSGAWRFNLNAKYIEPTYLQYLNFNFPEPTYFIDNNKEDLLIKLANKFTNILFIDSPLTRYKTVDEINNFLANFPNSITAINIDLLIYNRLTTSIKKVVDQLNGRLVGNFIIKGNK
jgi:hypothetical protein